MLQVASVCFSCAPLGLSFLQDYGLRHQNSQFPLQRPRIWCPDPIIAEGSCQTSTLRGRHLWHHSQKPCEVTLDRRFLERQGTKAANQINIHIERKQIHIESREVRSACETHSIQRDPTWSNVIQCDPTWSNVIQRDPSSLSSPILLQSLLLRTGSFLILHPARRRTRLSRHRNNRGSFYVVRFGKEQSNHFAESCKTMQNQLERASVQSRNSTTRKMKSTYSVKCLAMRPTKTVCLKL